MAIQRFGEGMGNFLDRVEKAKRAETAENLTTAAQGLVAGEDIATIQGETTQAQQHLGRELLLLETLRNSVDDFMAHLTKQLGFLGVGLPPVELLSGAPYELDLAPPTDRGRLRLNTQAIEKMRLALGNPDAFHIPQKPDDPNKEMGLHELNLSAKTYGSLHRNGLDTVRQVLSKEERQLLNIRNFGSRDMSNLLQGLASAGVKPIENERTSEDQNSTI